MENRDYFFEKIKNRNVNFLEYDIDPLAPDYSVGFLRFYCSFMIWNMGHYRFENDFGAIDLLNEEEKKIALSLIERNFKNELLTESFLFTLQFFKDENEIEAFVKNELLECCNKSLFDPYITILKCMKEQRMEVDIDFKEAIQIVLEKGTPEHIEYLLWSSETIIGEEYVELCNRFRDNENIEIREAVKKILK